MGDSANTRTIRSYDQHIGYYVDKDAKDLSRTVAYWPGVEQFLAELKQGETIFEIGSGTGADALRIEKTGHIVVRTDASPGFVDYLQQQGAKARLYNVLNGPISPQVNAIFANAVMLHFRLTCFRKALSNVHESLSHRGLFCFSVKLGKFEGWRKDQQHGERYFRLWQPRSLKAELEKAEFELLHSYIVPNEDFIFITALRQ